MSKNRLMKYAARKHRPSDIWIHFVEDGTTRAKCKYCDVSISISGGSYGNMRRHVQRRHPSIKIYKRGMKEVDKEIDVHVMEHFMVQRNPIAESSLSDVTNVKDEPFDWADDPVQMNNDINEPNNFNSIIMEESQPQLHEHKCITKNNYTESPVEDDEHLLFMRSLLPFFRKMGNLQTLRVRTKFQEILMQELGDASLPITSNSPTSFANWNNQNKYYE